MAKPVPVGCVPARRPARSFPRSPPQKTAEHRSVVTCVLRAFWSAFDSLPCPLNIVIYLLFFPLLELLFRHRVRRYLALRSSQSTPHDEADTAHIIDFWKTVLREDGVDGIVRGWFLGEGELRTGNMLDLIGWTLFAKSASDLDGVQTRTANRILGDMLAVVPPCAFPEGKNPNRVCMTHTLGPLSSCWKPLFFYLCVHVMRAAAATVLRRRGFELRTYAYMRESDTAVSRQ